MNHRHLIGFGVLTLAGAASAFAIEPPADARLPANCPRTAATSAETDAKLKAQLGGSSEGAGQSPPDELLERAAGLMRSAGQRLQQDQTGEETRIEQQDAVAALDELIKRLEQPPPPNQNNSQPPPDSSQNPPQEPQQNQQPRSQQQQNEPAQDEQQQQKSQSGESQDREQAQDSEDETRRRKLREAAELKRKKLQTDIWGHLPEHLREQLLNTYSERMLPKYEDLVRQFYERLADTPTRKTSR